MLDKLGKWLALVIVIIIFIMGFMLYSQNKSLCRLQEELYKVHHLAQGNSLPENVFSDIEILKNSITELRREGADSVYIVQHYLPSESEVHYVTTLDSLAWQRLLDISEQITYLEANGDTLGLAELIAEVEALKYNLFTTEVEFDTYGTCLEPVIGLGLNNSVTPEVVLGARLLYYNRLGVGLNAIVGFGDDTEVGIGGFIDSRLPYMDNVGFYFGGSYNFMKTEGNLRIGLQGYLN